MKLDVVIRVAGSNGSPADHIAALLPEVGSGVTVMAAEPFAAEGLTTFATVDELVQMAEAEEGEPVLLYGDERLLAAVKHLPIETVWMAVGPGANPLRNVWRLRGAQPWLGSARIALLLEDAEAARSLENSPTLTTGRILKVVTMDPLATVAAAVMPPEAEVDAEAETPEASETLEGASETMAAQTVVPEGDTPQALLTRYNLVRERRALQARGTELEANLNVLLNEVFAARFTFEPVAFEDLTGKLARVATEYRELVQNRTRVEEQLQALAWLKHELEI